MSLEKEAVQGDLFEQVRSSVIALTPNRKPIVISKLSDEDLIEFLRKANLTNIESVAEEILTRGIGDLAIVSFERLWKRFRGSKLPNPVEQTVVLRTLGQINQPSTRDLLLKIMYSGSYPESLLPLLLESAIKVRVRTSQQLLKKWLTHEKSEIRLLAFSLVKFMTDVTFDIFQLGLGDQSRLVRRETLICMGLYGYSEAKEGLLTELANNPTSHVIRALESIIDDDIITHLGRCAESLSDLSGIITEVLQGSESSRAKAVVSRLS